MQTPAKFIILEAAINQMGPQLSNPNWNVGGWTAKVPKVLQRIWATLTPEAKAVIFVMASGCTDHMT